MHVNAAFEDLRLRNQTNNTFKFS